MRSRTVGYVLVFGFVAAVGTGCRAGTPAGGDRLAGPVGPPGFRIRGGAGLHWYKGDTHTHSNMSTDADSPPLTLLRWYKDNGYAFVCLTDHNVFTDPARVQELIDSSFIVIGSEEITMGAGGVPVHINALGISGTVNWDPQAGQLATMQHHVDVIRNRGGISQINHPNLAPGLDTAALDRVRGNTLIEVYNANAVTNSNGGNGRPNVDVIWDQLLTAGREVYGVATDDAHVMQGTWNPLSPNPGRAWIVVRASRLAPDEILTSLRSGDFYATTGVELSDLSVQPDTITIRIAESAGTTYTTRFIGAGGIVLAETTANPAIYVRSGNEQYVRAKVVDSHGLAAWLQPAFVNPP